MKTDAGTNLVNTKTLAEILDLPPTSVRRYAREGKLPCKRIGRLLRFDIDDVNKAISGGDNVAASTTTDKG